MRAKSIVTSLSLLALSIDRRAAFSSAVVTQKLCVCLMGNCASRAASSSFFAGNEDWVSNAFDAEPAKNGNTALHTAALYLDGYVGKIIVECSLNNSLDGNESWSNVAEIDCDGTETDPVPLNYFGVFNYTRFKTSANPIDTITKILVRN